jgi:hypothetical protein
MSHHGLRRDLALFAAALERGTEGEGPGIGALPEAWQRFGATLHGHHVEEDTVIFPAVLTLDVQLGPIIDGLVADHRRIDPVLEAGDRAFAALPRTKSAHTTVAELATLLDAHLATEEARVIPFLRDDKVFPPPADDEEAQLYADGFAWSSHGVAPEVLDRVYEWIPESITSRLADARVGYRAWCLRVWGTADSGASTTSVPD